MQLTLDEYVCVAATMRWGANTFRAMAEQALRDGNRTLHAKLKNTAEANCSLADRMEMDLKMHGFKQGTLELPRGFN